MAIKKCKECGKEVSSQAKQCPHCGAPQPKTVGIGSILLVLFVGYVIYAAVSGGGGSGSTNTASSSSSTYTAPEPQTPPLELQSWRCDKEHGYVFVRGEVKNVSTQQLKNVVAVGEFRTKGGELVKSENALLDYNPIMPGQTSPFSAGGTDNPQIQGCQIGFKYLMGGTVAYVEKKKGK